MNIAFDARPLLGERTGVGVWLDHLLHGLAATTAWEFVLALPRAERDLGLFDIERRWRIHAPPLPLPGTLWLQTLAGPTLLNRASAYVGSLAILPRRLPLPAVQVVHDLTPYTRPNHHRFANRFCFNAYFAESLARADVIVCVSNTTRQRLIEHFPAAGRHACVITHGVDEFFSPPAPNEGSDDVRTRFSAGKSFIVQLGTIEPRKGIGTLLMAHSALIAAGISVPDLVLAGGRGWGGDWFDRALASHAKPSHVHVPGYVSREDARALLRHADLVVLASEEEGFGLPLLEAMACGAAVIASDDPALVEVGGGAVDHFPRGDAAALARAIHKILSRDTTSLRARSRARALEFRWDQVITRWRGLLTDLTS